MAVISGCLGAARAALAFIMALSSVVALAELPTVTIAATTHAAEPSTNGLFTLTRDLTDGELVVNYTVSGTAVPDQDYTAFSGTVAFLDTVATATISVPVLDDDFIEADATVLVTLTADAAYTLGSPASATVTLGSDDLGGLWAMGSNSGGQLGDGTDTTRNSPVQVLPDGGRAIAAGYDHSLALKDDGSLWAMGNNSSGQLGDGTYTPRNSPVQVLASGVRAVAAGGGHSLVLKDDGSLWAMGYNYYGQLGDGSTTRRISPVQVLASGVRAIAASGNHSLVLKDDGSLWAMGDNFYGQLGDGSNTASSTPVQVLASGVRAIAAGFYHSLYLAEPLPVVTIVANDASAAEPGDGGNFRVYRTGPTTDPLTVTVTIGGTATRGADYSMSATGNTKVVTIMAGRDYAGIGVPVLDDVLVEAEETIVLTVQSGGAAYTVGSPSVATITITDDEVAAANGVSVAASSPSAAEPGTPGAFTLTRSGDTTAALSVSVALTGTASAGTDYTTIASTLEIPAGNSTLEVPVTVLDDALGEANETVILTLQTGAGYHLEAPNQATVTIVSEDVAVSVTATDASAGEPANNGSYRLSRTGSLSASLLVNITLGGTATTGTDYSYNNNAGDWLNWTVLLPANRASVTVAITTLDDGLVEDAESISLTVAAGAGYSVGSPSTANITLTSDDLAAASSVSVVARTATASEPGTNGAFTLTRTGDTSGALSVSVALSGTATAGSDYTTIASALAFPAGDSTLVVPVTVLDDALGEANETVILTLLPGSGYSLVAPNQATVTISSEDVTVSIVATDPSAGEPASNGSFLVSRSGPTTAPLSVTLTIGGTATPGSDYAAIGHSSSKIITIPINRSRVGVQVSALDDAAVEGPETVTMTVEAGAGYSIGSPNTATVTITSDDLSAPDLDLPPGIHAVTPTATALGNELVIHGVGLSAKRVSASLLGHTAKGKTKRYALQVLEANDTEVRVRVKSGRVGEYLVELRLRGGASYQSAEQVSLLAPVLTAVSPEAAQAGDEITLRGLYFGTRRGVVSIGGKRAAVRTWSDDAITVRVPRALRPGTHAVQVRTPMGHNDPAESPSLTVE